MDMVRVVPFLTHCVYQGHTTRTQLPIRSQERLTSEHLWYIIQKHRTLPYLPDCHCQDIAQRSKGDCNITQQYVPVLQMSTEIYTLTTIHFNEVAQKHTVIIMIKVNQYVFEIMHHTLLTTVTLFISNSHYNEKCVHLKTTII